LTRADGILSLVRIAPSLKVALASRRTFLKGLAGLLAGAMPAARSAPTGDARIALVVGNDAYPEVPLANASNDAKGMAEVFAKAGFTVQTRTDAGAESMRAMVRDFARDAARPEVRLAAFFYAGHGVQVEWHNYLLPVDAQVSSVHDLEVRSFDLGALVNALPRSNDKTFLIILDACRDNPFGRAFHVDRKGLSAFDAPLSTLIAFSTAPGGVASDGAGGHGLYTENLIRELSAKGARIEDAFKRVRANVSMASRGAQIPWESSSLVSDVYLFPPQAPASAEEIEKQIEAEIAQYSRIRTSKNAADWAEMLRAFPDGRLAEVAQARLNILLAEANPGIARGLARHGPIELGEGLPVPEFLGRSANPFSSGTYPIARNFTVGDTAVFRRTGSPGGGGGGKRGGRGGGRGRSENDEDNLVRLRVTAVDREAGRVEINNGGSVTDLLGNPLKNPQGEYEVPVQFTPAELQVGKRWNGVFRAKRQRGEFDEQFTARVVTREIVDVPAGRFDAFRIEVEIVGVKTSVFGRPGTRRARTMLWEVPGLNFAVKRERSISFPNGGVETEQTELVSLRQAG